MWNIKDCFVLRIYSYNILIQQFDFIDYYWNSTSIISSSTTKFNSSIIQSNVENYNFINYFYILITEFNSLQRLFTNLKQKNSQIICVTLRRRNFWIFLDNCLCILFIIKNLQFLENRYIWLQLYYNSWIYKNINFDLADRHFLKKNLHLFYYIKFNLFLELLDRQINNNLINTLYWIPQQNKKT